VESGRPDSWAWHASDWRAGAHAGLLAGPAQAGGLG